MQTPFLPSQQLTYDTVQQDCLRLKSLFRHKKTTAVTLDLASVNYCDSAGLALLIEAKRLASKYKKHLAISETPEVIFSLAEFCGIEWILQEHRIKG